MKNRKMIKLLATWFGLGDIPIAPGTFGTLGAIPLYLFLLYLKRIFPNVLIYNSFYFMFLMTFFMISVYISNIAEKEIYRKKDPQQVVIDEVLGFLTTVFLINPYGVKEIIWTLILGFIIFRILDITKIGPIYSSQKLEDGVGVVLDDFLAGIIGNFILTCIWGVFF